MGGFLGELDVLIMLGGLFAGIVVGLTGMGGAAIVTPMLIFLFGVPPAVTVSTDVVSAAAMKPVGAGVHLMNRTPHMRIVFWLCLGSIPGVVVGTVLFAQIADSDHGSELLRQLVGLALVMSVAVSILRLRLRRFAARNAHRPVHLNRKRRILITVVGLVVGTLVGLTSVGSGTLIAASLILLFPSMLPSRLVGTDLVQAVPMLIVGALAHWGIGEIDVAILVSLLIGQLPGVWIGARVSSHYNGQALRLLLLIIVGASGLALLGLPTIAVTGITLAGTVLVGIPIIIQSLRDRNAPEPAPDEELPGYEAEDDNESDDDDELDSATAAPPR